ncbi:Sigma 54 modulation protein [Elusimicrobium minutum Pei191]|uniref:Ribosome hibernation promoting factor n=1 Tax=Elusimicrobium minutum (strain Pei191) TaxID=445932 RepID=B2KAZ3_ELUMP|nr:ribosome-associated translation inhibitor RaiA [Elusimicrobium minutum]ACC97689.1 Sigma 54 modulation protein [Elusimicrobium minutum Pei191]
MEIQITAKNIKLTPAIKDFAQTRLDKMEKYVDQVVWAQIFLSVDKKINQKAQIIVHVGNKNTVDATAIESDLYKAIDAAAFKAEAQLKKIKEKTKSRRSKKEEIVNFIDPVMSVQNDVRFSVIKQVEVTPMNPEDAVYEMERLGYTFWMFLDEDSKQINIIFKRLDSTYGLIKPVKKK